MADRQATNRIPPLEIVIPLCVMILGTVVCLVTDFDLDLSRRYYDPTRDYWTGKDSLFVNLTYHWGFVFSAIAAFWGLFHFFASYMHPRFWAKRAVAMFILLSIIIGPVIVVSGIGKETWRRPRPREVTELGGTHQFRRVLEFGDRNFRGKSFPGGHASTGFILVLFYFLLKKIRPRLAWAALLFGIGWGSWISYVRIVLGGHFFSDNLYTFGLNWFVVLLLYYKWYLPYRERRKSLAPFQPSRRRYAIGGSLLLVATGLLIFRFLFSTPFRIDYAAEIKQLPPTVNSLEVKVRVKKGDIFVRRTKTNRFEVQTWINGHALPDIQAKRELTVIPDGNTWRIEYTVEPQGFFYEYQSHNNITIPEDIKVELDLFTNQGSIFRGGKKGGK